MAAAISVTKDTMGITVRWKWRRRSERHSLFVCGRRDAWLTAVSRTTADDRRRYITGLLRTVILLMPCRRVLCSIVSVFAYSLVCHLSGLAVAIFLFCLFCALERNLFV